MPSLKGLPSAESLVPSTHLLGFIIYRACGTGIVIPQASWCDETSWCRLICTAMLRQAFYFLLLDLVNLVNSALMAAA